jgi:glycosyltransferase involved in cell wall biosynthesis
MIAADHFRTIPGGASRYVDDLATALSKAGVGAQSVFGASSVNGSRSAALSPRRLVARVRRVSAAVNDEVSRVGLLDVHFALYGCLPILVGSPQSLPLVVHFHGPWADESRSVGSRAPGLKQLLERLVYRRAREIVVLSGAFKRLLVERYGIPPWRITVIPPGVDLDRYRPGERSEGRAQLGLPEDAWIALAVRRLVPRTGIDLLLDAWKQVAPRVPDALLLVGGDGPSRPELEEQAERLGLGESVHFLGHVAEEELPTYYRAADVSVVPSRSLEGYGLVVLESLASGTPVLASDTGGLPESLGAFDPGLLVPAGNTGALATRLDAARSGSKPLPASEDCRAYAERFSWDAVAVRHAELYERVLNPPTRRKLRVVYLDHCAQLSGGEIALLRLLPALEEVEQHVVLAEEGPLVSRLLQAGISVEVLPMAEAVRALPRDDVLRLTRSTADVARAALYSARLARRLRALRPDIVHTNSLKAALYGSVAAKAVRVPLAWHVRDRIADDYLPPHAVRLVRSMARRFPDAVVAVSDATLATLGDAPALRRATVIRDPVPLSRRRRNGNGRFRVGMLGRIAPWKGQHVFLEAFARAFPDGGEQAVIVGAPLFGEQAYERRLHDLNDRLGLGGRVEFTGFRDDVWRELNRIDVLVHASVLPEPGGQVVQEGMAAGKAVVASASGGPAEMIEDGSSGLLYPAGDAEALAAALRRLASDSALRARLGETGRQKAREFAPEAVAADLMGVYRSVLAERSS